MHYFSATFSRRSEDATPRTQRKSGHITQKSGLQATSQIRGQATSPKNEGWKSMTSTHSDLEYDEYDKSYHTLTPAPFVMKMRKRACPNPARESEKQLQICGRRSGSAFWVRPSGFGHLGPAMRVWPSASETRFHADANRHMISGQTGRWTGRQSLRKIGNCREAITKN